MTASGQKLTLGGRRGEVSYGPRAVIGLPPTRDQRIRPLRDSRGHFGGWSPGELIQSPRWFAISTCRAFLISASRSALGGSLAACSATSLAQEARRSFNENCCLKRRRRWAMARSFPLQGAGARSAFSSQIKAKIRSVMVINYQSG